MNNKIQTPVQNFSFLEKNFEDFISKEKQISREWNNFFNEINSRECFGGGALSENKHSSEEKINLISEKIILFFRKFGFLFANLNPLEQQLKEFDLSSLGLKNEELEILISDKSHKFYGLKLKELIEFLKNKYLGNSSLECEHIIDKAKYEWIVGNYEKDYSLGQEQKQEIAEDLLEAELFEQFIHKKFQGSKRFSIEGGESSIVFFNQFLKSCAKLSVETIVLGMAHRGRLNFLTKICGENYSSILGQFAGGNYIDENFQNSGDVKYHLGSKKCHSFDESSVDVILMPNPSHLEAVNGPVLGKTRALQDLIQDQSSAKKKIIPFLIHGDASFVGQGVVYECLAMNNLDGYDVGGCIHLIIDNQVGFTASSKETRPSKYASDVAKTLNAPIIHINGDDPEMSFILAELCAKLRNEFSGDIIINLVCYRKFGHNEGDEPLFTQPSMYKKISEKKSVYEVYKEKLIKASGNLKEYLDLKEVEFEKFLSNELNSFKSKAPDEILDSNWSNHKLIFNEDNFAISKNTNLTTQLIEKIISLLKDAPNHVKINEKLKKLVLESRIKSLESGLLSMNEKILDWGLCEMLAFCGILNDGQNIRISGEDVVRGTFAHRHAAFTDAMSDEKYFYYSSIAQNNAKLSVHNSLLSEYAVMGFEFGYSSLNPKNLVIWEGQFGDFVNCAQVVIDQYISSSEQKWLKISNLVLMLPHGYEGQGPEHSSARIERFLQLAAQFNMRIVQPTTPSNLFHILRANVHEETVKKPLIIFTPKSLLRHRLVKSSISDIINGCFETIIFNKNLIDNNESICSIKKIILCSGKIYYDLYENLEKENRNDVLLLRIEALYPFPIKEIFEVLSKFEMSKTELIWCQDEPKNMGAYSFVLKNLGEFFADNQSLNSSSWKNFNAFKDLKFIGRSASASTANGSQYIHQKEQKDIIESCLKK